MIKSLKSLTYRSDFKRPDGEVVEEGGVQHLHTDVAVLSCPLLWPVLLTLFLSPNKKNTVKKLWNISTQKIK